MAKIIIEIMSDHRHSSDFRIFEGGLVRIGRGLDNDLILNDPFVSEKHLILSFEEEKLKFQDLQSCNGTYVPRIKHSEQDMFIPSGEELIVGRTRIRVFLDTHPVPPAKQFYESNQLFRWLPRRRVAWGLLVLLMGVTYTEAHITTIEDQSITMLFSAPIIASTIILMWAGFWALLGRLLAHRIHFTVHVSICCLWFLVHDMLERANDYLCFYLNNQLLHLVINYLIYSGLFILTLMVSLNYATNMTRKSRIVFAALFTSVLVISVTGMRLSISDDYADYYLTDLPYDATLKPPVFGVRRAMSVDQFVENSRSLYDKAGQRRTSGIASKPDDRRP